MLKENYDYLLFGLLFFISSWGIFPRGAGAQNLKLPALFSDNMVIQREQESPIWGQSEPNTDVLVSLGRAQCIVKSDAGGKWSVKLPSLKPGGPFEMIVECGEEKIVLKNMMIGDVWICSGQSNMEWPLLKALNGNEEAAAAKYPNIRLFMAKKQIATDPLSDTQGRWQECSPEAVKDFSGVGYFFGREIHKKLNVPIGLIQSAWGGTPIESWMSVSALRSDPDFLPIYKKWKELIEKYPEAKKEHDLKVKEWEAVKKEAEKQGKPVPEWPLAPYGPSNPRQPNVLFNGMIQPLIPYGIKGVIWYQGESNFRRGYQYRNLFPVMIEDWRARWGQGNFPFLFVQLPNYKSQSEKKFHWPEVREAQLMCLAKASNTGMAITIDIGEPNDLHPPRKQEVGRRLALAAMKIAYGQDLVYSGPIYKKMTVTGERIAIEFDHADGGLITRNEEPLKGFVIAGEDRNFVLAQAKIEGNSIIVWNDSVKKPAAVRYAWESAPEANLYNKADLPASPFRTDTWTGDSEGENEP